MGLLLACLVVATLNTFYYHLLVNLRFLIKMKNVTCGFFFFDCINCLACYCLFEPVCKDNCKKKKGMAILKWIIIMGLSGFTAS